MNLLPRPRFADLGDRLVANKIANERIDATLPAEGYELRVDDDGVDIVAGDEAGRFYAQRTLSQLARIHDGQLPAGTVRKMAPPAQPWQRDGEQNKSDELHVQQRAQRAHAVRGEPR